MQKGVAKALQGRDLTHSLTLLTGQRLFVFEKRPPWAMLSANYFIRMKCYQ